ncbi:hypothetical protein C8R44DRAFT_851315 [Mycena epipterygia]|nr:hypothetical protein C8R44DRAFT_851315 [Mycena epipterygia]
MTGILEHCTVLYGFAHRYAQLQASLQHVQPPPDEVAEMARRANEVVRLLEELRRMNAEETRPPLHTPTSSVLLSNGAPGDPRRLSGSAIENVPTEMEVDQRPPKRPWEDMEMEEEMEAEVDELEEPDQAQPYPTPTDTKPSPPAQTTAEQDMELIRTKRASTTGVGVPGVAGQPKSKYRKRSRATPPGKCHSCNIRETPEWRRGPDGARTLCNACGLHYAKLMRKREKEHNGSGTAPQIDMDTLRASARADMAQKSAGKSLTRKHAATPAPAPAPAQQQDPPPPPPVAAHYEGSFQLTGATALSPSEVQAQMAHAPHPPPTTAWAASGAQRAYAPEQLQHQSFMRTPQIVGQTSPR